VNSVFLALLPLAHSTVSGHLRVLRAAGLVGLCDDGSYCIEPAAFDWLAQFSRTIPVQVIADLPILPE
jgi:DNA-binding IclR family transcriptional regulator